jgi:hypothetical protein
MPSRLRRNVLAVSVATLVVAPFVVSRPLDGQTSQYRAPRSPAGGNVPNLNGTWQVANTANWDILDHPAQPGPVLALGAWGAVPPGQGVVEGNDLPYRPEALARKRENAANRLKLDPEVKCFLPGVPRAMYMPYPHQIVQTPTHILMAFQYANTSRLIDMTKTVPAPVDTWMGYSSGTWDGDTLVIDSRGFNDQTWFDRAGNYHSNALRVVERITPASADVLRYEATIEDTKVFTRPWKMSMNLYRRTGKDALLLEFNCVEFVEELMYGDLVKKK